MTEAIVGWGNGLHGPGIPDDVELNGMDIEVKGMALFNLLISVV